MVEGSRHRVVVIGGGFAGLRLVRGLKRAPVDVTLIDRRNFHLFQPLLYQVATGGLSPANIATPLRSLFRRQDNCRVLLARATGFSEHEVVLERGRVPFDTLVIACGVTHSYFGHDQWEQYAPGLKTIEDATAIRGQILMAFEEAERTSDAARRQCLMTFVIVGGGPTGVELAGTLSEIARHTLRKDFRTINPREARVILVEASDEVLGTFAPKLQNRARDSLKSLGVDVRLGTRVVGIAKDAVTVDAKHGGDTISAHTILWAAGVKGADISGAVAKAFAAERDRAGRIHVEPDFTIPNHPEVFVVGDLASYKLPDGSPLPGMAQAAMQGGTYISNVIAARVRGESPPRFHYRDLGTMATIGRAAAVANIKGWKFSGLFAWLLWLFVHLMSLVEFQNRLLVLTQWAWNYISFNRSARLITSSPTEIVTSGPDAVDLPE